MKRLLMVGLALVVVSLGLVVFLTGCASEDRAAAQRANSEAALETARGQAYAERVRADAAAAAERAAIREAAREASHQRAVEMLPIILIVVMLLLVVGLAVWLLAFRAVVGGQSDPALLYYLERQRLEQAEIWRAIAHLERRRLQPGDGRGEVTIYRERGQGDLTSLGE